MGKTVRDLLKELSPDDDSSDYEYDASESTKIWNIKTMVVDDRSRVIEQRRAYFVATDSFQFWHEGSSHQKPSSIVLQSMDCQETPLVYSTCSGSGKTVELAGSAIVHDAHLALCLRFKDPTFAIYNQFSIQAERIQRNKSSGVTLDLLEAGILALGTKVFRFWNMSWQEGLIVHRYTNNRYGVVWDKCMERASPQEQTRNLIVYTYKSVLGYVANKGKDRQEKIERIVEKLAFEKIVGKALRRLLQPIEDEMELLVSADEDLKLVVAIDEANLCTRLIRSILRVGMDVTGLVRKLLRERCANARVANVRLSIAGLGIVASTIGLPSGRVKICRPYHDKHWKNFINTRMKESPFQLRIPAEPSSIGFDAYEIFEKHLPMLAILMQNGRMSSIALKILRELPTNIMYPEEDLLINTIRKFSCSNGVRALFGNEKKVVVGASVLAIHLFRSLESFRLTIPSDLEEFARDMNFMPLNDCTDTDTATSIDQLVTTLGLVELSKLSMTEADYGKEIPPPIVVKPPQQLMALHMLGLKSNSMIAPSWQDVDKISTHMVKSAIAASMAIKFEKRPSLYETLTTIGFKTYPRSTSTKVQNAFEEMKNWKAIPRRFGPTNTYQMQSSLDVKYDAFLSIDSAIHRYVERSKDTSSNQSRCLELPLTTINQDKSPLPDGFCTFYATRINQHEISKMCTVAIQGMYITSDSDELKPKKWNNSARLYAHASLDGLFGATRILCGTHPSNLQSTKNDVVHLDFLHFAIDKCSLLGEDLLVKLHDSRRQKACSSYYNRYGNEVSVDSKEFRDAQQTYEGCNARNRKSLSGHEKAPRKRIKRFHHTSCQVKSHCMLESQGQDSNAKDRDANHLNDSTSSDSDSASNGSVGTTNPVETSTTAPCSAPRASESLWSSFSSLLGFSSNIENKSKEADNIALMS